MALYDLQEVHYGAETAFAENENAAGSLTYDAMLPIKSATFSPSQDRIERETILARRDDSLPGVLGPKAGTLELQVYLCGHGAAMTGAATQTWLAILLEKAFGGYGASQGTTASSAANAYTITPAATTGWAAGEIGLCGVKADARGDGQAFVVGTVDAALNLLTAVPTKPDAADVIYGTQTIYPKPGSEASVRFLGAWTATGAQWHFLGCQLESISLDSNWGEPATLTLRYAVATWLRSAVATPSASTMAACCYAPSMGGSVYMSVDTTRATIAAERISLRINTSLSTIKGPTAGTHRVVSGYERLRTTPELEIVAPWATTHEALYTTDGESTATRRILVTLNTVAGRACGFYLPAAYRISPVETPSNQDGRIVSTWTFRGREYTAGADDITKSAWRLFMG